MTKVDKVTIRLTEEQANALDFLVSEGSYKNRSEAIRASIDGMISKPMNSDEGKIEVNLPDTMLMVIETLVQMDHFVSRELGIRELVRNGLQQIDVNELKSRHDLLAELGEKRSAKDLMDEQYQNMFRE